MVLPADIRRRLEMRPGDELVVTEEPDGTLRLQSRRCAAHALIGLAGHLEHSAVDDLRDDRHRDTAATETTATETAAGGTSTGLV